MHKFYNFAVQSRCIRVTNPNGNKYVVLKKFLECSAGKNMPLCFFHIFGLVLIIKISCNFILIEKIFL